MKVMKELELKVNIQNALKRERTEAKENYKTVKWRMTWEMTCPMIN